MAATKESFTESFSERLSEFSKHAYKAMRKDSNRHQDHRILKPLVFDFCNGSLPRSFSDADTNYRKQKDAYQFDVWYLYSFKRLLCHLAGGKIENEDQNKFHCLLDHFLSDRHSTCLKEFSNQVNTGDVKELNITTIMALHYFKPLMPSSQYAINKGYRGRHGFSVCKFCKEPINYGDTSIGNSKVWHGKVDILLNKSVVKVSLEEDMGDVSIDDSSEDEDESACEEAVDEALNGGDSDSDLMTFRSKAKPQMISQAIVNAFYNSSKNNLFYDQFIPSFLVTEKNIRVVLYNCKSDVFLMSTKMPIWKKEGSAELDLMTLIRVWLALNYSNTLDKRPEEYKFMLENTMTSRFQNVISTEAHSVYLKDLHQPMSVREGSDFEFDISDDEYEFDTDTDTRAFKLKCLMELNTEVHKLKMEKKQK